jgi:predicted transcriptional regulator
MSSLSEYLLSQIMSAVQSLQSGQRESHQKLEKISDQLDERLSDLEAQIEDKSSWEQRIVWLGLALAAAILSNWDAEKWGEALARLLRGVK